MILGVLLMSLVNATFINFFLSSGTPATQNSFQSSGPMALKSGRGAIQKTNSLEYQQLFGSSSDLSYERISFFVQVNSFDSSNISHGPDRQIHCLRLLRLVPGSNLEGPLAQ